MISGKTWVTRLKDRLKRNGFSIVDVTPSQLAGWKRRVRIRDRRRIKGGLATPAEIQRANSLFLNAAECGRVVDFGGLNKAS